MSVEDEFGLVEMESGTLSRFALVDSVDDSGPVDRFEDGDSEEHFVNANIFVENLDDFDAIANGAFSGARLFVNTGKYSPRMIVPEIFRDMPLLSVLLDY